MDNTLSILYTLIGISQVLEIYESFSKRLTNHRIISYNVIMITKSEAHELSEWQQGAINRLIKSNHMISNAYEVKSQEITGWVGSTVIISIEWGLKGNQYFGQHCIVAAIGSHGSIHSEKEIF